MDEGLGYASAAPDGGSAQRRVRSRGDKARGMDRSLFRFILRHSRPQQLVLLALIFLSWPINYLLLDLPKSIINRAIGGEGPPFFMPIFGIEVPFAVDQVSFLFVLCFTFLVMVVLSNGLKYVIGVYKGRLAERLLRRLRYILYAHVLRFPLPHFKRTSQGELISMISAEAEQVGNFTADAFAQPVFLGGQLFVALGFIVVQDPWLGLAAMSFYPIQIYVIPKLQRKVSQLAKRRLREVRHLSDHIGESVGGIVEIHANDGTALEQSRFADRLGTIYGIRFEIFRRKFFIKFLNNFIDKLAPFFFYSIGGYLVIEGSLTIGALVAVVGAHKDMSSPWKELLAWYQQREDARVKYEQIVSQFDPEGMLDPALQDHTIEDVEPLTGTLKLSGVGLVDEDEITRLTAVSFEAGLDQHVAVVGGPGSGKEDLGLLLARLAMPTAGKYEIGGHDATELSEAVTGRRLAYVGPNAFLQSTSVGDNLRYALKQRPRRPADYADDAVTRARSRDMMEARITGNIDFDYLADWVDLEAAGIAAAEELTPVLLHALALVEMRDDIYSMGLRGTVDPVRRADLAENILKARVALRDRLKEAAYAKLVELFDRESYNASATVAENVLFGTPVDDRFNLDRMAENAYVLDVLRRVDTGGGQTLYDRMLETGQEVARTMVEIFADLPPGHEFFEQFAFISSEELPDFQLILSRAEKAGPAALSEEDRTQLLSLPFKLTPARHRLGLVEGEYRSWLLEARRIFADDLPAELADAIEFFDSEKYNAAASIQDNILFGKVADGVAGGAQRIGELLAEMLDALGLRGSVMEAGLEFQVGVGGSRLSAVQRQKLALARCLLRRPDLLIVNDATAVLDSAAQGRLIDRVQEERADRGIVWVVNRAAQAEAFDLVVVMADARAAEVGTFADLNREGGRLALLLQSD